MYRRVKSSIGLLAISLIAILSIGCGSNNSNDVFTATGDSNGSTQVGNLAFAFTQVNPQTAGEVPNTTTLLRFDMFSSKPPTAESRLFTEVRPYADSITINDVPTDVVCVVVTALDGDNFPLITLQGDAEVILGTTTPVDLGNAAVVTLDTLTATPDPVNVTKNGDPVQLSLTLSFSNGSIFNLPSFDTPEAVITQTTEVANVTSTGLISTGVGGQTTAADVTYTLGTQSASTSFTINTYCLDASTNTSGTIMFPTGNMSQNFVIPVSQVSAQSLVPIMYGYGGSPGTTVTSVIFTGPDGNPTEVIENCTFALANAPVTGVTIDPNTGVVVVDETAQDESTITVIVTYVDPTSGLTLTDTQDFLLVNFIIWEGDGKILMDDA